MIIEFYTPDKGISELTITSIRDTIVKLHREHKEISRAEVSFIQRMRQTTIEKTCEIDLFVSGNSITAKATSKNFDNAAKKVIADLNETVALSLKTKSGIL
jgi:ribosome-associated translation inhibitor RaiA